MEPVGMITSIVILLIILATALLSGSADALSGLEQVFSYEIID